jgi:PAS domain S-box-containing protein
LKYNDKTKAQLIKEILALRAQLASNGCHDGETTGASCNFTEHVKVGEILRDNVSLLNNVSDAVISTDENFNILTWNRAAENIYGWKAKEVLGKPTSLFLKTEYLDQTATDDVVHQLRAHDTWRGEVIQRKKDGSPIYISASITTVKDQTGHNIGVITVNRDVTDRKQAEVALHTSEEQYRSLFYNMTEGFALHEIVTDSEGNPSDYRFLEVNPAFERLTGLKDADLAGKRVLDVLPGTERYWIEQYGSVALTGEPAHFENFSSALDRWYDVFAYQTAPRKFAVVFTDITDRKRADAELRESRESLKQQNSELERHVTEQTAEIRRNYEIVKAERKRLYDVLDTLPVYVILLSEDYRVPFANKFFNERFGESKGRRCYEYLFNRTESCEVCESYVPLNTNAPHHWYWTGPDKRDYDIYDYPLTDADGSRMIMEVGIDITEIKKAHAALQKMNETLEQRVAEQTAELRESKEDLTRAQEVGHIGSWRIDVMNNKLLWSDESYQIFGIPQGTPITYETFLRSVHPDDREYVDSQWKSALTGNPYDVEHRILVNNEIRWVHEKGSLENDGTDALISGFGIVQDITELKHAMEKIRWLAKFPLSNPFPVLRISSDGVLLFANDASKELLQLWQAQVGETVSLHWRAVVNTVLKTRKNQDCEILVGKKILMLMFSYIQVDDYVNVYGLDITNLKKAEKELRESRNDLAHAQEVGHIGSWRLDIQKNELLWSDENHRIFGIPRGTPLTYEIFLERAHPDDREYVHRKWTAALNGEPYDIEHRIMVDGVIKWVREKAALEFDDKGVLKGGFGITQDITQKKQVEAALQTAYNDVVIEKNRIEAIMESLPVGMAIVDESGGTVRSNHMYDNIWGSPRPEARCVADYHKYKAWRVDTGLPVEPEEWASAIAIRKGETVVGQIFEIERFDNTRAFILNSATPILDSEGKILGSAVAIQDITELKRNEEKIRRQSSLLQGINTIFEHSLTTKTREELGRSCLSVVEKLTGSRFGFIGEIKSDGTYTIAISDPGWDMCTLSDKTGHRAPSSRFPIKGLYGRVLTDGLSILTNDPSSHPDSAGVPEGHPLLEAFLGVPLMRSGKVFGIIALGNRPGGYRPEDQEAVELLAPAILEALERKEAEVMLVETKDYLNKLLNYANAPIIVWNPEMRITFFNSAFEKLTGYTSEEVVGRELHCILPPGKLNEALAHIARTTTGEYWETVEIPILRKDGKERIVLWNSANITSADGTSIIATIAQGQDITERKIAEKELILARDDLEIKVLKRTEDITRVNKELQSEIITRRITEEKLREISEMLGKIFSTTHLSIAYFDKDFKYLQVNRAYVEQAGSDESFFIGKNHFVLFPDEMIEKIFVDAAQSGETISAFSEPFGCFEQPGADPTFWDWTLTPVKDKTGTVEGSILILVNVTDRVLSQKYLQEREQRFRELADSLPQTVIESDSAGHITFINSNGLMTFGYTYGDFHSGLSIFDVISPEDSTRFRKAFSSIIEGGKPFNREFIAKRKNGTLFLIVIYENAIVKNNTVTGIRIIILDITERKALEDTIRSNEIRLKKAQLIAHLGYWDWNIITNDMYWSDEVYTILGRNQKTIKPSYKTFLRCVHPDDRDTVISEMKEAILHNRKYNIDHRIILPGHEVHYINMQGESSSETGERVIKMIGTILDITPLKVSEQKRLEAVEIAEKTSRLASIGAVTGGITHEINQPLNAIKVTVDGILFWYKNNKGLVPVQFIEMLERISASVERINSIIVHMRSFWSNSDKVKREIFNLNDVVASALSILTRQLSSHGIKVETHLSESPPILIGDRIHLEQTIINLMNNSMKALDEVSKKEKTITVTTALEDTTVQLVVSDNGTGFPDGIPGKLFDEFYTTRKPGEGMGLGLVIVKRFVEEHNGAITCANNPLGGAIFTMNFPLSQTNRAGGDEHTSD